MIKIMFLCLGNICRSPMAHLYFADLIRKNHLEDKILVDSAATSYEEIGNPVYPGARKKLAEAGISCEGKYAKRMDTSDYQKFDLLIGMDQQNIRNILRITGGDPDGKIYKMMDFAMDWEHPEQFRSTDGNRAGKLGKQSPDVADPWYTGDFDTTWQDITAGCAGLLKFLKKNYQL